MFGYGPTWSHRVYHGPTWSHRVRHCPICSDIFSDMTCVRAWVSEVRGRVSGRGLFPLLLRHWEGECQAKKFLRNETTRVAKNEMGDNACGGPYCTHHPPLLPGYSHNHLSPRGWWFGVRPSISRSFTHWQIPYPPSRQSPSSKVDTTQGCKVSIRRGRRQRRKPVNCDASDH